MFFFLQLAVIQARVNEAASAQLLERTTPAVASLDGQERIVLLVRDETESFTN